MSSEINIKIQFNCPFYECCILPKIRKLCNYFSKACICPEYQTRKEKLKEKKDN